MRATARKQICYSLESDINLRDRSRGIRGYALIRDITQHSNCEHKFEILLKISAFSDSSEAIVSVGIYQGINPRNV